MNTIRLEIVQKQEERLAFERQILQLPLASIDSVRSMVVDVNDHSELGPALPEVTPAERAADSRWTTIIRR